MSELTRRYGLALYEVAQEKHLIEEIKHQSQILADVLSEPELYAYLLDVSVEKSQKLQLVQSTLSMFEPILINFLMTVITNNRFKQFQEMVDDFETVYRQANHIVIAKVTAPMPLNLSNQKDLAQSLSQKYQKQVQLDITIDESLISGLRIEIEQDVLDNTLIKQLNLLKHHLKKGGSHGDTGK